MNTPERNRFPATAFSRFSRPLALMAFAMLTMLALLPLAASAQEDPQPPESVGSAPLTAGVAVTGELATSDLLVHLGLAGWVVDFTAPEPFSSVSVAVVAMQRAHLEDAFTRTPVGAAFTVERPQSSTRAQVAILLDTQGEERDLTLRIGDDTSHSEAEVPELLRSASGVVRRPFAAGIVVPTDPEGRLLLMEAYPDRADGFVSTGETADMLAYLALEISVE